MDACGRARGSAAGARLHAGHGVVDDGRQDQDAALPDHHLLGQRRLHRYCAPRPPALPCQPAQAADRLCLSLTTPYMLTICGRL